MVVKGGVRVVHSDPAATIKIGGSGVCIVLCAKATNRSHFLFLAAGYIIVRLAGGCGG